MAKKRNELNGVLVYRRWCVGAILSTLLLLVVIAAPVLIATYKWISVTIPANSLGLAEGEITIVGIDLIRPILHKEGPLDALVAAVQGASPIKYLNYIYQYGMYGVMGFLGIIALFAVIEAIFALFYIFTGRVVSPGAPVKLSWVLFVFMGLFAGISIGLLYMLKVSFAAAEGADTLGINFLWPLIWVGVSFVGALFMSIIYVAAFKDKFYIGRAKRFGSGESGTVNNYETTHIITPGGTTTTQGGAGQPQVIVVNTTPGTAQAPIYAGYPNNPQPIVVTSGPAPVQAPVNNNNPEEAPVAPAGVIPPDIKSIGGHAFSKNLDLKYAEIPYGIKELGVGAFANCLNLEVVDIPKTVKRIKKNCFFNTPKLTRINYGGTKNEWRYVVRGSNWLERAGTKTVVCSDGAIIVDPHR